MLTVGRIWVARSEYKYCFIGKESEDEIEGNDDTVNFGERIYNGR